MDLPDIIRYIVFTMVIGVALAIVCQVISIWIEDWRFYRKEKKFGDKTTDFINKERDDE